MTSNNEHCSHLPRRIINPYTLPMSPLFTPPFTSPFRLLFASELWAPVSVEVVVVVAAVMVAVRPSGEKNSQWYTSSGCPSSTAISLPAHTTAH